MYVYSDVYIVYNICVYTRWGSRGTFIVMCIRAHTVSLADVYTPPHWKSLNINIESTVVYA